MGERARLFARAPALWPAGLLLAGCLGDPGGDSVALAFRPDAGGEAARVDVRIQVAMRVETRRDVPAGELIDYGRVKAGSFVQFQVFNTGGAAQVRANVLVDGCFRATHACRGEDCLAMASCNADKAPCVNE